MEALAKRLSEPILWLISWGSFGGTGAFSSGIMRLSNNMMDRRERADVPEGYSSTLLARVSTGTF